MAVVTRSSLFLVLIVVLATLLGCNGSPKGGKSLGQQQQDAMKLSDPGQRARKLCPIADKQHKAGDVLGARSTLASARDAALAVKDPASRASALTFVAGYYAKLDQSTDDVKSILREAAKAADEITDPDVKIRALSELAAATGAHLKNATLAASYLKTAEEAAGGIESVVTKVTALARIAVAYHKVDRADDFNRVIAAAQELARTAAEPRQQCDALAEIGAALARAKQADESKAVFDEAEQVVATIPEPEGQAYALLNLAEKLSAAGRKDAAHQLLAQASTQADKVSDGSVRGPLVEEIETARKSL